MVIRGIRCLAPLLLLLVTYPWSIYAQSEGALRGEIILDDGTKISFDRLLPASTPFARRIEDIKDSTSLSRQLELVDISRIEFLRLSRSEALAVKSAGYFWREGRKARVVFQDGEVYDPVFIAMASISWEGPRGSGIFEGHQIREVVFFSSFTKKGIMKVFTYSFEDSRPDWRGYWKRAHVPEARLSVFESGTDELVRSTNFGRAISVYLRLPPGAYDVRFECEGWKTILKRGIMVVSGEKSIVNLYVERGSGLVIFDYLIGPSA